jgi:hypothetical protein
VSNKTFNEHRDEGSDAGGQSEAVRLGFDPRSPAR